MTPDKLLIREQQRVSREVEEVATPRIGDLCVVFSPWPLSVVPSDWRLMADDPLVAGKLYARRYAWKRNDGSEFCQTFPVGQRRSFRGVPVVDLRVADDWVLAMWLLVGVPLLSDFETGNALNSEPL